MRVFLAAILTLLPLIAAAVPAEAGNVVSRKTGASATVGARYVAQFQAYIDELEARGAVIRFMGGIRRGRCSARHMHPCGRALDVCQRRRDRVDPRCRLPSRRVIAVIARRHGLFEGGQWCHGDYGHAQAGVSAPSCETRLAHRHHRVRRYHVAHSVGMFPNE